MFLYKIGAGQSADTIVEKAFGFRRFLGHVAVVDAEITGHFVTIGVAHNLRH